MKRQRLKRLVLIGIVAMLAWILAGCSANSNNSTAATDGAKAANMNFSASSSNAATDTSATTQVASESAAAPAANADSSSGDVGAVDRGSGSGSEETTAPIDAIDRKIIYRANVNMEVEDFDKAHTSLQNLIHLTGGYLLKFADKKTTSELGGTYTVKVPASGFNGFITELEKIKHVSFESSAEGTDVTQEYVDLEARLKARKVVEERLLSFMEKATKTTDLLAISKQLGDVQTEIEQIKGRMKYLDNNVAYSTIDLRLYQVLEPQQQLQKEDPKFVERIKDAMTGSTDVIYAFFQGLVIFIAGALPVLVILVILGIPLFFVYRSNRRKSKSPLAAKGPNTPTTGTVLLEERREDAEGKK